MLAIYPSSTAWVQILRYISEGTKSKVATDKTWSNRRWPESEQSTEASWYHEASPRNSPFPILNPIPNGPIPPRSEIPLCKLLPRPEHAIANQSVQHQANVHLGSPHLERYLYDFKVIGLQDWKGFESQNFPAKFGGCILWTFLFDQIVGFIWMNQLINVIPSRVGTFRTFLLDLRCGQGILGGTSIHLSLYGRIWDTPTNWVYRFFK